MERVMVQDEYLGTCVVTKLCQRAKPNWENAKPGSSCITFSNTVTNYVVN